MVKSTIATATLSMPINITAGKTIITTSQPPRRQNPYPPTISTATAPKSSRHQNPAHLLDFLPSPSLYVGQWRDVKPEPLNDMDFKSLYVRMYVCTYVRMYVCQSVSLSVCQSVSLSVCQSVPQSVCQSVSLSVCQSVCLPVYSKSMQCISPIEVPY